VSSLYSVTDAGYSLSAAKIYKILLLSVSLVVSGSVLCHSNCGDVFCLTVNSWLINLDSMDSPSTRKHCTSDICGDHGEVVWFRLLYEEKICLRDLLK